MIYEFGGYIPVVHETAFVHPLAAVTGNVIVGEHCYIGPGAALRGDFGPVVVGHGCNVQESCTLHAFPGVSVVLEASAHIGHGAVIHGARIGENALIGMNAVVMDDAVVGAGSIVGALCFVPSQMQIPERKVVLGVPARIVKDVTDEMLAWKTDGTQIYQALPAELHRTLREVEPLRQVPAERVAQTPGHKPWKATRQGER